MGKVRTLLGTRWLTWLAVNAIGYLLAYGLASLYVHARGGRAYRDNPFEREAYER